MQELENILEEIKEMLEDNKVFDLNSDGTLDKCIIDVQLAWNDIKDIIRKHMNDGWIPVEERLPEPYIPERSDGRMTPEEAIKQLEFDRAMILFDATTGEEITPEILKLINGDNYRTYVADGAAIEALKEIQQYRAIGTVDEIKAVYAENKRWHTNRINKKIKNPFANTSTLICQNCDHKDEYIQELEAEIEKYRSIGTAENLKKVVEKQMPKIPQFIHMLGDFTAKFKCPICGIFFNYDCMDTEPFFCKKCGQTLRMEDEDDTNNEG